MAPQLRGRVGIRSQEGSFVVVVFRDRIKDCEKGRRAQSVALSPSLEVFPGGYCCE